MRLPAGVDKQRFLGRHLTGGNDGVGVVLAYEHHVPRASICRECSLGEAYLATDIVVQGHGRRTRRSIELPG